MSLENRNDLLIWLCVAAAMLATLITHCNVHMDGTPDIVTIDPPTGDTICVVLDPIDIGIDTGDDVVSNDDQNDGHVQLNFILLDNITIDEQAEVIGCINKNIDASNAKFHDEYQIEQFYLRSNNYTVQIVDDNYSIEELMKVDAALENLSPLMSNNQINIIVTHNSAVHRAIYDINSVVLGFVFGIDDSVLQGDNPHINNHWIYNVMVLSMAAMRDPSTFIHEFGHMNGLNHCCNNEWNNATCNMMISHNVPCASTFTPEQVERMEWVVSIRTVHSVGTQNRYSDNWMKWRSETGPQNRVDDNR